MSLRSPFDKLRALSRAERQCGYTVSPSTLIVWRPLVRHPAWRRVTAVPVPQGGEFLAQPRQLLAQLEHRLVLLADMPLQVDVALLEQGDAFRLIHAADDADCPAADKP